MLLLLIQCQFACDPKPPPVVGDPPPYTLTSVTLLTDDGGRVDWSPDGRQIAFDRLGDDGKWDLWLMDADGGNPVCLSCSHPDHPTDFMPTHPGAGVYNDLVAMRMSDRAVLVIRDVADAGVDVKGGTLHPVFSNAGDQLLWTDYQQSCWTCPLGDWRIALAPFAVTADVPSLGEFRAHDEHAKLTPARDALMWLNDESGIAEYWLANPDGSGRFQLTDFNTDGHAHSVLVDGRYSVPSDNAWNPAAPAGRAQALGFIQVDLDLLANAAPVNIIVKLDFDTVIHDPETP